MTNMTAREALETIAGGHTSRFPGAPDPMHATSPKDFQAAMWTWSQQVAKSALAPSLRQEPATAPVAWRVWTRGRKFTRGIYEKPTQDDFAIWKADGDEVEPLYLASADKRMDQQETADRVAAIRDEVRLFVDDQGRRCSTINQADYEWLLEKAV